MLASYTLRLFASIRVSKRLRRLRRNLHQQPNLRRMRYIRHHQRHFYMICFGPLLLNDGVRRRDDGLVTDDANTADGAAGHAR